MVVADGAELLEGASVSDVVLAEDDGDHRVFLQHDGRSREVTCRWLADASGRRALLRRKLGLEKDIPGRCSSAWFRLDGRLSIDTFVPEERADWHRRVRQDRYFSTNHLMGPGYWVWLIPLAPHFTSVGIVTMEEVEPFDGYNTMEKARDWLVRHEPLVAEAIKPYGILDFRVMRRYSHTVHRVFSAQRWSCVGDAGAFVDPYYSVGSNMIGFANSMTTRMVMLDRQGQLTEQLVDHYNTFYLSIIEALTFNIQITYPCHENAQVMALKTIWDFYVGWSIADPQFYHQLFFDPVKSRVIADVISRQVATQQKMMALFRQWAERSAGRQSLFFDFIDYIEDLPTLRALFLRNQVREGAPFSEILDDFRRSVDRVEELAHVVFFMAVEDVLPDALPLLRARGGWFNTAAIGLDPDAWERDGLFAPVTERRDISPLDSEIRRLFRSSADWAAYVADGVVSGDQRAAVVFVHGNGLNGSSGGALERFFTARGHAWAAPDLPGHGDCPPVVADDFTLDTLVGVLASTIRASPVRAPHRRRPLARRDGGARVRRPTARASRRAPAPRRDRRGPAPRGHAGRRRRRREAPRRLGGALRVSAPRRVRRDSVPSPTRPCSSWG